MDASSTGEPEPTCDNGRLDPGEQCDGGRGCSDCVLDDFSCNPVNNAGCRQGEQCIYTGGNFACSRTSDELGGVGDLCSDIYSGHQCEPGLGCFSRGCPLGYGLCCLSWCDTSGAFAACDGECRSFWGDPNSYPGLQWLGYCVPPEYGS